VIHTRNTQVMRVGPRAWQCVCREGQHKDKCDTEKKPRRFAQLVNRWHRHSHSSLISFGVDGQDVCCL
jgi:hypothetical protein